MIAETNRYSSYYADGQSEWRWLSARDKTANIVRLCTDLPHKSILDVGAGEGSILAQLSELNFGEELFALEISESGAHTIHNRKIQRLRGVALFDGYQFPFAPGQFDIAVLSHVIEHVEDPRQLIYEASRSAKYVFVEVPLEDTRRLDNDYIPDSVGHINFYSKKTIRRLLQTCGLKIVRQVVTNPSREIYTFQRGWRGLGNFYLKRYLLHFRPELATALFTYHSALVGAVV